MKGRDDTQHRGSIEEGRDAEHIAVNGSWRR